MRSRRGGYRTHDSMKAKVRMHSCGHSTRCRKLKRCASLVWERKHARYLVRSFQLLVSSLKHMLVPEPQSCDTH